MLKKLHIVLILSVLLIGIFSINTYAAEVGVPHSKDSFVRNDTSTVEHYMLFKTTDGKYHAFVIYDLAKPTETDVQNRYKIEKGSSPIKVKIGPTEFGLKFSVYTYRPEESRWASTGLVTVKAYSNSTQTVDGSLIYSTFDVLNDDNTPFFQPTPVEVPILEKIMEMTPTIAEKIVETLRILVPFGVGLLALWIGLLLLPKILYKFLLQ